MEAEFLCPDCVWARSVTPGQLVACVKVSAIKITEKELMYADDSANNMAPCCFKGKILYVATYLHTSFIYPIRDSGYSLRNIISPDKQELDNAWWHISTFMSYKLISLLMIEPFAVHCYLEKSLCKTAHLFFPPISDL